MDIYLSAASRNNLLSLQNTTTLQGRTQERLATGLKVNSALDDPNAFFTSRVLEGRANDYNTLLQDLGQVVQTVKTAVQALDSIETLLNAAKAKAGQAQASTSDVERAAYLAEFVELHTQIEELAADASYKGVNLLGGDQLTAEFSVDDNTRELVINPTASADTADYSDITALTTAGGLGLADQVLWDTTAPGIANIAAALDQVNAALVEVRTQAGTYGTAVSIVENRIDFTRNNINILEEGSGKLILADQNEESANLLALNTRQALGTTALQLTSQAEQGVLRLF